MEYNSKSLTREGATMLALADQEEKALIIDEVIVSEKVITAGTDISTLTMADFTSPLTYGISSKVQSDNQFSVKSVITNHWQDSANTDHTTNKDFNVALVGVVAHVDGYVDQHVLTVAVGNDPFVLPAYQGTDVSFVFGITQAYSASQNVTIKMDGSAYALATDLDDVKNLQGSIGIAIDSKLKDYAKKDEVQNLIPDDIATTKNLADGDATTLKSAKEYADTKISGKADDSAVVHTADMRKPANQVASIDEVNAKQDKLDYTPANDTNVVHRNPNTGVVSEPVDFTKLTVEGGKSVATRDDLKSLEASAWRELNFDVSQENYKAFSAAKIVYKINRDEKYISFFFAGTPSHVGNTSSNSTLVTDTTSLVMDLSSVLTEISGINFQTEYGQISDNNSHAASLGYAGAKVVFTSQVYISNILTGVTLLSKDYPDCRIYYTSLVNVI